MDDCYSCHLVADIGGTHTRFAWVHPGSEQLQGSHRFNNVDYDSLEALLETYLSRFGAADSPKPCSITMAVAAAVQHDHIRLTNYNWEFSRSGLARRLGIPVSIINDFSAQAWFLSRLSEDEVEWWQRPSGFAGFDTAPSASRTVVGPGTGFGAATLTPGGEVIESEPGHCSFAPVNMHELQLLQQLWQSLDRVSVEDLLSGPGLANLLQANAALRGRSLQMEAPEITAAAADNLATEHELSKQTAADFAAIAGSVCGDIALSMGCLGGFFLSGNMLDKMRDQFDTGLFMERFCDKGPFSNWCREVPVARILRPDPGLLGCAVFANRQAELRKT